MADARPSRVALAIAFACIWFVWGSTFLAIRVAIDDLPPLLMCGIRLTVAGLILGAWAAVTRAPWPRGAEWGNAALVGILLPAAGNGSVTIGEMHVPSGVVALLVSSIPLWMALLASFGAHAVPPGPQALAGLTLGFGGVALLLAPGLAAAGGATVPAGWALVPVLGSLSWAWGSLWSRRVPMPSSPLVSTGVGLLAGGLVTFALSVVTGDAARFRPQEVGAPAWLALAYLSVFGSVFGFSAYLFLLRHVRPAVVSTYAFINPVVALVLGAAFLHEPITPRTLLAGGIVVAAVALITTAKRAPRPVARVPAGAAPIER